MHFLSPAQEKAHRRALQKRYKAVAFDIDGTLTKLSRWIVPASLCKTLIHLPPDVPLALCTGRPADHIELKLAHILQSALDPHKEQRRWTILAENGGIGYLYHYQKRAYEPFFEISWPDHLITKDAMEAFIKDKFGWHVQVLIRDHSLVVRFQDWIYLFPRAVRLLSRRVAKQLRHLFEKMGLNGHFQVQDSGIGSLVIPESSGKGKAIARWARQLKIPVRDILVIGDQAAPGENDEEFLSGRYGTAFTVGHQTANTYPLPVLDERGKKLWGPEGTEYLLKELFAL